MGLMQRQCELDLGEPRLSDRFSPVTFHLSRFVTPTSAASQTNTPGSSGIL